MSLQGHRTKRSQACNCLSSNYHFSYKAMTHRPVSLYPETHTHVNIGSLIGIHKKKYLKPQVWLVCHGDILFESVYWLLMAWRLFGPTLNMDMWYFKVPSTHFDMQFFRETATRWNRKKQELLGQFHDTLVPYITMTSAANWLCSCNRFLPPLERGLIQHYVGTSKQV